MQGKKHTQNWKAKISMQKKKKWMDVGVFCISTHVSSFPPPLFAAMMFSPIALSCTLLPFHRGWLMTRGVSRFGGAFLAMPLCAFCFPQLQIGNKETPWSDRLLVCLLPSANYLDSFREKSWEKCEFWILLSLLPDLSSNLHFVLLFFFYCLPHFPLQSICCYSPWI